tara:strand:- start:92 stop:568 length:477 start_codon:yes stop_codon:yes gene_type:complete
MITYNDLERKDTKRGHNENTHKPKNDCCDGTECEDKRSDSSSIRSRQRIGTCLSIRLDYGAEIKNATTRATRPTTTTTGDKEMNKIFYYIEMRTNNYDPQHLEQIIFEKLAIKSTAHQTERTWGEVLIEIQKKDSFDGLEQILQKMLWRFANLDSDYL